MTNVHFDFRRGGGSATEILYGKVELKPTIAFQRSTTLVLPAPTTIDLVGGEATALNVYPTPEPVNGEIEWAYRVKVSDRYGKTFEWMVGVPDSTTTVEFAGLPRYFETKPKAFGQGPKGEPGEAATVAVGTVSGGTTASVTNSGTNTDAVLDFVLPKGDKGDKGDGVPAGGTALQYIRKDATNTTTEWATLDKAAVGLSNVDNTSDANKPVSTAQANAISNTNILANFTKTLSDAPTTYPQGVSVTRSAQSAGWPGDSGVSSDLVVIVTQRSSGFGGGASQWVYQYNNPQEAPRYRVGASNDTWGEFESLITSSRIVSRGAVDVRDYGAVGDGTTDDTAAIQQAINVALAQGRELLIDGATYLVTSTLLNFWNVKKTGKGYLNSNGVLYPVTPGATETTKLYVDASYVPSNGDGLSPTTPLNSLVAIGSRINLMSADQVKQRIEVNLKGQFQGGITYTSMPNTPYPIVIQGEPLASGVPVTSINYTTGGSAFGMRFEPGANIIMRRLKFSGFSVGFNGYGALMKGLGKFYVEDCEAVGCDIGFAAIKNVDYTFIRCTSRDNNSDGFRAQYSSSGAWQYCTSKNNQGNGYHASRNAVSHLDYSVAEGNYNGLIVDMAARVACIQTDFKRNSRYGVLTEGAAEWRRDDTTGTGNKFYVGTPDANGAPFAHFGASRSNALYSLNATNEYKLFAQYNIPAHTGTTANTAVSITPSGRDIPADFFMRDTQKIRFRVWGRYSGIAGTKTLAINATKLDGSDNTVITSRVFSAGGSNQTFVMDAEIIPQTETVVTGIASSGRHLEAPSLSAINTVLVGRDGLKFRLYVQLADALDSVSIGGFEVYVSG